MASAMSASRRASSDQSQFLKKWLGVWVALLAVVTLVVVVFLVTITNSLASINENLAVADDAVTGIGGDVTTLPDAVDTVNASLGGIDPNLKPIPGQADAIIASLTSINAKLTNVDNSLKDTSPILTTVLGQASEIRTVLVDADDPPDQFGVQNIHRRVAVATGVLQPVKADLGNVIGQLTEGVKHLVSICRNSAVGLVPGTARPLSCG